MKKIIAISAMLFSLSTAPHAIAADDMAVAKDYMPTLITATPFEGRQLAIKLARKSIGTMQSNGEVKHKLRPIYSEDAGMLLEAAEVIALEFQTIAAANNYWRK